MALLVNLLLKCLSETPTETIHSGWEQIGTMPQTSTQRRYLIRLMELQTSEYYLKQINGTTRSSCSDSDQEKPFHCSIEWSALQNTTVSIMMSATLNCHSLIWQQSFIRSAMTTSSPSSHLKLQLAYKWEEQIQGLLTKHLKLGCCHYVTDYCNDNTFLLKQSSWIFRTFAEHHYYEHHLLLTTCAVQCILKKRLLLSVLPP